MTKAQNKPLTMLGSVSLGATFIFRTVDILGPEYANSVKPRFEGQVLTVMGFKPRYVNNVVVREQNGHESLMPLDMVEKALSMKPLRVEIDESEPHSGIDLTAFASDIGSIRADDRHWEGHDASCSTLAGGGWQM